jgi:hypothetical protein
MRVSGFTVLELVVATAVGAIILLAATSAVFSLASAKEQVGVIATELDAVYGWRWLLTETATDAWTPTTGESLVVGTDRSLTIQTWCENEVGSAATCSRTLAWLTNHRGADLEVTDAFDGGGVIRTSMPAGDSLVPAFVYLNRTNGHRTWAPDWSVQTPPAAIGVALETDTLVFMLGRGGRPR